MSVVKIAIVNDTLRKVINTTKYNEGDVPKDEGDLKYIPVLDWMAPNIEYGFDSNNNRGIPQFEYEYIDTDGSIKVDEDKKAEYEAEVEESRKDSITNGAFTQQNAICDENMRLFFFPLFTNPLLDWTALPKLNCYKIFMEELWAERDVRKEGTSTDSNFETIVPTTEYSFNELMTELQSI